MIQMLAGVFGLPVKNGNITTIKAMDKDSGPFEAGEEQERRLVALGLAEYVIDQAPIGFDETPADDPVEDAEEEVEDKPLEELNRNELRAVCQEYGLPYKATDSKDVLIAKIKEFQDSVEDAEEDDAPVFDASEAVQ